MRGSWFYCHKLHSSSLFFAQITTRCLGRLHAVLSARTNMIKSAFKNLYGVLTAGPIKEALKTIKISSEGTLCAQANKLPTCGTT
jgi:hypothetical protein